MQRRVTEMDQRCRRKLDGRGQCESNIKVKSPMFALKNFNGQKKMGTFDAFHLPNRDSVLLEKGETNWENLS